MEGDPPKFYAYAQDTALEVLPSILQPHLPFSNALFNRILAPHNLPSRHCLFAATFAPPNPGSESFVAVPTAYTILFADRSRHDESQIWIFNPIVTHSSAISSAEEEILISHLKSAVLFLKKISIPEAPGWPFNPILRFACLHETLAQSLIKLCAPLDAITYLTRWNLWNISTKLNEKRSLPEGFSVGRVPDDQLDVVLSTSSIERQVTTMKLLPSVGLLNNEGKLVAWAYIGIDGSFATLYVLPEVRGKGLASYVARDLLSRLNRGEFSDKGFDGRSGFVHSDVYDGNKESEAVMKSLCGSIGWTTSYVRVDTDRF